jgi:hypothetical protein
MCHGAFNKRKNVQFIIIFYLLTDNKLMINFESMRFLPNLIEIKHYPKKHWCYNEKQSIYD